jgi:Glycosyl hydrolase 108
VTPNFLRCVGFTILRETGGDPQGAYTSDPHDPGGETKWGISGRFHPKVDIKNLTRAQAEKIYLDEYWMPSGADSMPWPLCLAVFDSCVIPGIGATRLFIRCASADPARAPFTRALIVCNERESYFRRRADQDPSKKRYLNGWVERINAVRKELASPAP